MNEKLEEANILIVQKIPTLRELRMLQMQLCQHVSVSPVNNTYHVAQVKYLQVVEECKQKQGLLDEISKAELFIKKNETAESKQSKVEKTEAILLKSAYGPGGSGPSLREASIKDLESWKLVHGNTLVQSQWMGLPYGNTYSAQVGEYGKIVVTVQKLVDAIIEAEAFVMDYRAIEAKEKAIDKLIKDAHEAKEKAIDKLIKDAHEAKEKAIDKLIKDAYEAHKAKLQYDSQQYQLVLMKEKAKKKIQKLELLLTVSNKEYAIVQFLDDSIDKTEGLMFYKKDIETLKHKLEITQSKLIDLEQTN